MFACGTTTTTNQHLENRRWIVKAGKNPLPILYCIYRKRQVKKLAKQRDYKAEYEKEKSGHYEKRKRYGITLSHDDIRFKQLLDSVQAKNLSDLIHKLLDDELKIVKQRD